MNYAIEDASIVIPQLNTSKHRAPRSTKTTREKKGRQLRNGGRD
jgi:hypothetical protein